MAALVLPKPPAAWGQLRAASGASVRDSHAVDQAAISGGSLLLWGLLGWLALAVVVMAATALPGRWGSLADGVGRLVVPTLARRVLCGALSVSLVGGLVAGPAHAAQRSRPSSPESSSVSLRIDLTQDFDWPPSSPRPDPAVTTTPVPAPEPVVVAPGDCLWNIASRSLGEKATEAAVALEWPRWWERNRDLIGGNPHLIHPGQRLDAPTPR